jgi:hypothetical protein
MDLELEMSDLYTTFLQDTNHVHIHLSLAMNLQLDQTAISFIYRIWNLVN